MQTFLTKYWLATHVWVLLAVSWYGMSEPRGLSYVPLLWFAVLAVEAVVLLPSVRRGETLADGRTRFRRDVLNDPFTYLGLAFAGMALIQWLNSGCSLVYLADADIWKFSPPPVSWLPFSVERLSAFSNLSVFTACVAAGVVLRHGVNKGGKRGVLQAAAALSGGIACVLAWKACAGVEPYAAQARAPGASGLGPFFCFWLIMGIGVCADALMREQRGAELLFAFAFVGNLVGMLFFAGTLSLLVCVGVTLLMMVYWLLLSGGSSKATQVKLFLLLLVVCLCVGAGVFLVFPGNAIEAKIKAAGEWGAYWGPLSAERDFRSECALKIWEEHPWVGAGADGFSHQIGAYMDGKDWALIKRDSACVRNDAIQFLCEFGALGIGLLLSLVVSLLVPICYRMRMAFHREDGHEHGGRFGFLQLSPLVVAGGVASLLVLVDGWFESPFRTPAVFMSWFFVVAMLPGFLPAKAAGSA